jgi:hypothetical protein
LIKYIINKPKKIGQNISRKFFEAYHMWVYYMDFETEGREVSIYIQGEYWKVVHPLKLSRTYTFVYLKNSYSKPLTF